MVLLAFIYFFIYTIFNRITNTSNKYLISASSSEMTIDASLFGERHQPDKKSSITNICSSDLDVERIAASLARSVVANLREMFGNCHFDKIIACGGAFNKNPLFREALKVVFEEKSVVFEGESDAALGAAMSVCL